MIRPWMPLYIADYRADTAHLGAAQHGAYMLLIMHYWTTGGLPKDDLPLSRIACMTPSEWKKDREVIAAFFTSNWHHKRIDFEIAKSADISSKRRTAALQKRSKAEAIAELKDTHAGTCAGGLQSQAQEKLPERKQDAASPPSGNDETELFRRGKEVCGANAGGLIARLLKIKGGNVALARSAIEMSSTKENSREYLARITQEASEEDQKQKLRDRGEAW